MSLPPGMDLSTTPAGMPPNGTMPNLVDPYTRGPVYIATASVFMGITTVFVLVRFWVRFIVQRSPWWDDVACTLALLSQGAYCGLNIWMCLNGVGTQIYNLSIQNVLDLTKAAEVMAAMTEPAIGFTKLTLMLFYYRLFSRHFGTKVGIFCGIAAIVPVYTVLFFLFLFLDTASQTAANKAMAVFNVFSDFYLLLLPLPAVLGLNLPVKKKLGLVILFSTGLFCCIMSLVGAVYRFNFAENEANFTWSLLDVILINTIECCVGIMCTCLPLFPAIINNSAFGHSVDWFKVTMQSIRVRLMSSRSRVTSDDTLPSNHIYRDSVYMTQEVGDGAHGKAGDPSYSSIQLTIRNGSKEGSPPAHQLQHIGNDSRVDAAEKVPRGPHPLSGVEVVRDYTIQRE